MALVIEFLAMSRQRLEAAPMISLPLVPAMAWRKTASRLGAQPLLLENFMVLEPLAIPTSTETVPGVVQEPVGGNETTVGCWPLTWSVAVRAVLSPLT